MVSYQFVNIQKLHEFWVLEESLFTAREAF